ncbi:MAG: beta-ketoacyl-[acyl-carrier-protein] synthase family protein [Bacteroidales bacterium]|jgi:3-oxoacyl-[acyl-carrier-protein] synthase-1|nr:beta-ketoacyl-[acyl-carrier-protein] synthase family protein [Bacteroidales bacterium]
MSQAVISSMGMVSAIGNSCSDALKALKEGRSGIEPLRFLQTAHCEFPVGEVKMSNEQMCSLLGIPQDAVTTRTSLMGMLAVKEALQEIDLQEKGKRIALISGTTVGGMDKSEQYYLDFLSNDNRNAYISTHDCGACSEMIADYFGIFTFVNSISTACSSAANAILLGAELIKSGRVDMVVAGGSECLTKFHLNGFNTLMILDKEPCRPFDASRAGLNLGEGAAYVVIESAESADKRGIEPLCVLKGYGNACDAYHQTASSPDGNGAFLAMKQALANAKLQPEDIDYINAHGTGTQNNDLSEGRAIERVFGDNIPPISSTKSFTGHTTSAAGGVEAVISILALRENFIPLNLNFSKSMPELSFTPSVDMETKKPLTNILSNSFGFGGNDTSLIFSKL